MYFVVDLCFVAYTYKCTCSTNCFNRHRILCCSTSTSCASYASQLRQYNRPCCRLPDSCKPTSKFKEMLSKCLLLMNWLNKLGLLSFQTLELVYHKQQVRNTDRPI